ncbi:hypothetical protein Tco_0662420 [Tanacetum coccineum]
MLLGEWFQIECSFGDMGDIELVRVKLPKKLKKRKYDEEYVDYIFPEESQASNLKILEQAYKWKKRKLATAEDDSIGFSCELFDQFRAKLYICRRFCPTLLFSLKRVSIYRLIKYPSTQPGYNEQAAPNNEGYGYQGTPDPAYGAPPVQPAYSQPTPVQAPAQPSYPQTGGYGSQPQPQVQ